MSTNRLFDVDFALIESGEEFEFFCEDLLKALNYNIISHVSRGPDEGKDIIATKIYTDEMGYVINLKILVECKHHAKSGKSVKEDEVGNILERTIRHKCNRYLLITSTLPCTKLANQLDELNSNSLIPILTNCWAKNDLAKRITKFPKLKEQYFSDKIHNNEPVSFASKKWNILLHEHPDLSAELREIIDIWNESQVHFLFATVRPSEGIEAQLRGTIHTDSADGIADSIRTEAGFNHDDEIIQFCEVLLNGEGYNQLLSFENLHDGEPRYTATISLDYIRKISKDQNQEATHLLTIILHTILHVLASGVGVKPHKKTNGCIMDLCENKDEILVGIHKGAQFCAVCENQLKRMGAYHILKIVENTERYIQEKRK